MARKFSRKETAYGDQLFASLRSLADNADVAIIGDGETELTVGPAYNRTLTGNLMARAGFPGEEVADEEFLRALADAPPRVDYKGVTLARHASGLLIAASGYNVNSRGEVTYDYNIRTLRTVEEPSHLVSARAVGELSLELNTSSGDLMRVRHDFTELGTSPVAYFTTGFNPSIADQLFRQVVAANQ